MLNTYLNLFFVAIIVAIPFYFQYWVQSRETWVIREINAKTSKLTLLLFGILIASTFLGTHDPRNHQATFVLGASILSFFLLFSFRSKVVQRIRGVEITAKDRLVQSLRSFGGFMASIGLYYLIVFQAGHSIGTLPAVVLATLVVIATAPLMVRILFSCQRMYPSALKDEIRSIFHRAGVDLGEIYLMDTDKFKVTNALVCGSKYGFGPLKRSLFLTQNLFQNLDEEEVKAVICHEASHFQLHHIAKRGTAALLVIAAALVCVGLPLGMIAATITSKTWISGLTVVNLIANLVFQYVFIFRVIRKHEFEADLNAVKLGASAQALIRALEKITLLNGAGHEEEDSVTRYIMGNAHPSFRDRKEALMMNRMPESARILPAPRFVVAYATIFLVIGAWFVNANHESFSTANREVASEKNSSHR